MTKDTVPRVLNFDPDHEKTQSSVRDVQMLQDFRRTNLCVFLKEEVCVPIFVAVHQNGFLWQGARSVVSQKA